MRLKRTLRGGISALAIAAMLTSSAFADPVPVRASGTPEKARIVFDWTQPVETQLSKEGNRITLTFSREVESDLSQLADQTNGWAESAFTGRDKKQVVVVLNRKALVRNFYNGKSVVVDLLPSGSLEDRYQPAAGGKKPEEIAKPVANAGDIPTDSKPGVIADNAPPPVAAPLPAPVETKVAEQEKAPEAPPAQVPVVQSAATVRYGEHPGYGRVVFAVGSKVPYKMEQKGDVLELTFEGGKVVPEKRLGRVSLPQLESAEVSGERVLRLALKPGVRVRDFQADDGFGVDLLDPAILPKTAEIALAPKKEEPKMGVPMAPPPAPEPPKIAEVPKPVPAPEPEKVVEAPKPPPPAPVEEVAKAEPAPEAPAPKIAEFKVRNRPDDAPSPVAAPVPTPVMVVEEVMPSAEVTLPGGAGIAVLRRGDTLLVAVNGAAPADLTSLVGSALVLTGKAQLVPADGGRVAAITLPAGEVYPSIAATSNGWRINFLKKPGAASNAAKFAVEKQPQFALGARVLVKGEKTEQPVVFRDPVVGDVLTMIPVAVAGASMEARFRTPQLDVLPTLQGVAVRRASDDIAVVSTADGVDITASGGLKLAEVVGAAPTQETAATETAAPLELNLPPLFDFKAWAALAQPNYTRERQRLEAAVIAASPEARDAPRVDLARFYFMRGMPVEASAVWQVVGSSRPELADRPEYHLMDAIGRITTGDLAAAKEALVAVSQPTTDAALWRGFIAMRERNWKEAVQQFRVSLARLEEYPEPYYSRLAMAVVESFAATGDQGLARDVLGKLTARQQAEMKALPPGTEYLSGMLSAGEEARTHFNMAAAAWQQYWRVRAEMALADADLADKKITVEEAIRRYERLRYAWRGDALEYDIVQRLAHLHIQALAYAEAMDDYQTLLTKYPNEPRTPQIQGERRAAFHELFLGPPAEKVPARAQYAVWKGYPELQPQDVETKTAMQRGLAERIVGIDLLDQAGDLFMEVLATVKDPVDRSKLGARIAGLKLLDHNYTAALGVLNATELLGENQPEGQAVSAAAKMPDTLSMERRYLRAQTLSGLDQAEAALALLSKEDSDTARRLKVDITWRARRWSEAASAIQPFIGAVSSDSKLTDEQRAFIVRRATALALAGDTGGLAAMRMQYASAMDATVDGPTFQLLTRPDGESALADAATLGKRVAEVQLFSDFLTRYKSQAAPAAEEKPN